MGKAALVDRQRLAVDEAASLGNEAVNPSYSSEGMREAGERGVMR
jgi:hypothetical protein